MENGEFSEEQRGSPQNVKHEITIGPSNSSPKCIPEEVENNCSQK
jgi:hypothetical protein